MQIKELQAKSKGTPAIYAGRKYISRCNYRREFEIDEQIVVTLIPKMIQDENGNETPMLNKQNEPIMERRIYIPFRTDDGELCLTQTKSPLIWNLIKNLPVIKTEKNIFGNDTEYRECIEGKVRFGEGEYRYGDKKVPVVTLEAAEED